MRPILIAIIATCSVFVLCVRATNDVEDISSVRPTNEPDNQENTQSSPLVRDKRFLFHKAKVLGAGLLGLGAGLGLGGVGGYNLGQKNYASRYIYVSSPPLGYVEYVPRPYYNQYYNDYGSSSW